MGEEAQTLEGAETHLIAAGFTGFNASLLVIFSTFVGLLHVS